MTKSISPGALRAAQMLKTADLDLMSVDEIATLIQDVSGLPELLEACKQILPDWEIPEGDADGHIACEITNGNVRAIVAAISKSRGTI